MNHDDLTLGAVLVRLDQRERDLATPPRRKPCARRR